MSQVRLPPPPPSELGTSLSEILLTVFLKFVELGLTDQFSSILVSKHLRRLGHSIWGVGPPPPLLGQCPKFVTFFFEAFPKLHYVWIRVKCNPQIDGHFTSKSNYKLVIIISCLKKCFREGFKKKRHELGTLSQQGGGGPTPQIECPNLLKCFDTKIELNWSVSPKSTNFKKHSKNFNSSLKILLVELNI